MSHGTARASLCEGRGWCVLLPVIVCELPEGGMTLLLATREMGFAREVSNKVCFLHQGVLVAEGRR